MAPYPALADYQKRGNFKDGIKRCDDLLKKNPNDIQLLTVKLQLLHAVEQPITPILQQLLSIRPPIQDIGELLNITEAVANAQRNTFPLPSTAGPEITQLWSQALNASTSIDYRGSLLLERFTQAIMDNYLVDAQQALIQLKALQPKNRVMYMAHAAITQLLSSSPEDLQSRLALSLARKAVTERFDEDRSVDCRVPGQIFALQESVKDLESIRDRPFKESRQVANALRTSHRVEVNGNAHAIEAKDAANVNPTEWLASEITGLKHDLKRLVDTSADGNVFEAFAISATRLFRTSITTLPDQRRRGTADACFLAISSLIKLYELRQHSSSLLCAAYLAEALLQWDSHVHEARLILVYLYMRLGLGSLAVSMFVSLSIKETQFDTVGHSLFTRLAILHPHDVRLAKGKNFVFTDTLEQALAMYARTEQRIAESEANVLNHGQTGMIFDLHQMRNNLRSSTTKRIIMIESRRARRLIGKKDNSTTPTVSPRCAANWITSIDNRDFDATFSFGFNVEKALYGHQGTVPKVSWIMYSLAADATLRIALKESDTFITDPKNLLQMLSDLALNSTLPSLDGDHLKCLGLSHGEFLTGDLMHRILRLLICQSSETSTELTAHVDAVSKAMERLNVDALLHTSDPIAEHLMDHYLCVDALQICAVACGWAAVRFNGHADPLQQLRRSADDAVQAIQAHARKQTKEVTAGGVKNLLHAEATIFQVVKEFGEADLHHFCKSVAASAIEGWEGFAKVPSLKSR